MAINDTISAQQTPVPAQPMAPVQGQAPAQPPGQPQGQAGMEQPTPEEQADYEKVVLAGLKTLNDPQTAQGLQTMLGNEQSGDPAKRLARAAATIVSELDERSGNTIPEVVILPAAGEILENVAEFANSSGAMTVDESMLGKASQLLVVEMGQIYGFDPADFAEIAQSAPRDALPGLVEQQNQYAMSGQEAQPPQQPVQPQQQSVPAQRSMPQPAAPATQPQQSMPSIINQVVGG